MLTRLVSPRYAALVLKALLQGKLPRRVVVREDDADNPALLELTRREDLLTAAVFSRLAYLPSNVAWDILRRAAKPLEENGVALPRDAPPGAPRWFFWPKLRPGADGGNTRHVEPDVLVSWGDTLLVCEAKHEGEQYAHQWVEQLRAVRAMPEHSGKPIWFLAVGGIVVRERALQAAHVRRELTNTARRMLALCWEDLHHAIDDCRPSCLASEQSNMLNDIVAALYAWGYRKKTWFSSLCAGEPSFQSEKALAVLQAWRVQ